MSRTGVALVAGALVAPLVGEVTPAQAGGTAKVVFVDHYSHGRVEVTANGVTRKLRDGDRKGPVEVTPDPSGNDAVTVSALRHPGCGEGDAGKYFNAGHRYKIVITAGDSCTTDSGTVRGPMFTVKKVS